MSKKQAIAGLKKHQFYLEIGVLAAAAFAKELETQKGTPKETDLNNLHSAVTVLASGQAALMRCVRDIIDVLVLEEEKDATSEH